MAHGMVETEVNMVNSTNSDTTIMYVLIIGAMLLTFLVVLGLLRLCCQRNTEFMRVAYPVAISNRLFQVSPHLSIKYYNGGIHKPCGQFFGYF